MECIKIHTAANGETVSVSITSPPGYNITGSPQTAVVYRALSIGMDYLGGKIAYILGWDDPGYDPNVPHGLIISDDNLVIKTSWSRPEYATTLLGTTEEGFGTGPANTEKIVAQHVSGTRAYTAGLADEYEADGYTDWFLPSKDELVAIFSRKEQIENVLGAFPTFLAIGVRPRLMRKVHMR